MDKALNLGAFSFSGFVSAVLYHETDFKALAVGKSGLSENAQKERYFLISIGKESLSNTRFKELIVPSIKRAAKKRTNRKTESHKEEIDIGGYTLPVNSKKSGCYLEMLQSMASQLVLCYEEWKRVFVYRFDLHQAEYTENSEHLSRFIRVLRGWVEREYKSKMGFAWVREQEKSKAQHYHVVVFIDGDNLQYSGKLGEKVKSVWEDDTCGARTVPTIESPFHKVNSVDKLKEAFYRVSYMAKVRGKGFRPPQSKDFGTSRLKF
ncbi:MAG: hypothetical protein ISEC1_P1593 [Thiomicrorhabdus sp.]|nr:MAG: hypothetical protein ISEC1_P1593 [Thiomicrorhabdus sp.]